MLKTTGNPVVFFYSLLNIGFYTPILKEMKKIIILSILFSFIGFSVCAKNINFQIVQNTPLQEDVFEISSVFEQALADFFFESGHIVSNTPVYIYSDDSSDKSEIKRALVETVIGSMDYLVRVKINFTENGSASPKALLLECIKDIDWEIFSASTGKSLGTGRCTPEKIDNTNNNESGIYNFASFTASKISSGLQKSK